MTQNGGWFTIAPSKSRTCNRCGCPQLAWAQSKRNGKWYLANTRHYIPESDRGVDLLWVMPNSPHNCDAYRDKLKHDSEREQQQEDQRQQNTAFLSEIDRLVNLFDAGGITREEFIRATDEAREQFGPRPL